MEFLCTICCKDKRTDPGMLPAIDRYLSDRIGFVHRESLRMGMPMLILSGKYGLLRPEAPIPWYDQKLVMETVPALVPLLVEQLEREGVTRVAFYGQPETNIDWYPYHAALEQACERRDVEISHHTLNLD